MNWIEVDIYECVIVVPVFVSNIFYCTACTICNSDLYLLTFPLRTDYSVRAAELHRRFMVKLWRRADNSVHDQPQGSPWSSIAATWPHGRSYSHVLLHLPRVQDARCELPENLRTPSVRHDPGLVSEGGSHAGWDCRTTDEEWQGQNCASGCYQLPAKQGAQHQQDGIT